MRPHTLFTHGGGEMDSLCSMAAASDPPFVAERPLTRAALRWARELHGGQVRAVDHAPFILHPLEVAALLSGRGFDDEVVAAGLLHDAVEETVAGVDDIRTRFGDRVARIVADLTEDPDISDYRERKAALRTSVGGAGADAQAIYAADKIVKTRELRAQAARAERLLDDPDLQRRLEHYERSLEMLESVAPDLPLVRQLAFELWALHALPPRP
jgi:(p)ppGpp synthase/HD superfamily hydrolase